MPAFLIHHEERFEAKSVQALIEGIYAARPETARKILRARIYVTTEPSLAEKELIRVAAKRWSLVDSSLVPHTFRISHSLPAPALSPLPELPLGISFGSRIESEESIRMLLDFLLAQTRRAEHRFTSDRPVAAILLDRDRHLLAAELNTNAQIRTRHAEMNLILRLGSLPKGSTLIVTLKPCAMCAARIWEAAEDLRDFRVIYLEDDPGKFGRNTVLTRDSPARLRFLGSEHPLYALEIQRSGLRD